MLIEYGLEKSIMQEREKLVLGAQAARLPACASKLPSRFFRALMAGEAACAPSTSTPFSLHNSFFHTVEDGRNCGATASND